jgi:hypothetical protein
MNIFAVEKCPTKSARALPDKLIVKMPLETAQMLSTAHRLLSPAEYCETNNIYKTAFQNHPCTIWARETHENYRWLLLHFIALCEEYTKRYDKYHLCWTKLYDGLSEFPMNITEGELTPFAQAMPDEYKSSNHVDAYRKYMINEKHYAKWEKGTSKPKWWK